MARAFPPLDEEVALLPGAFGPRLVADMVHLGAWIPFPRLPDVVQRLTGTPISEATIRRTTEAAGAAYVAVQDAQLAAVASPNDVAMPWYDEPHESVRDDLKP